MKADLHNHSMFSPDGGATYKQIIDTAHKRGVDFLAITDHDYQPKLEDMLEVDKYADKKGMHVFLGVENTTSGSIHVQSFYPILENNAEVKQYLLDRDNLLEGIQQAGSLMQQVYSREGFEITNKDMQKYGLRESMQTLFFFTAMGLKFPELYGKTFADNRKGAKGVHDFSFDKTNPSTMLYLQTTCDLADLSEEFHAKLKDEFNIVMPEGSSKNKAEDLIRLVKKYEGISVLAHPGLIKKDIFESNINGWIDAGLSAISCEGYPYMDVNSGLNEKWDISVSEANAYFKEIAKSNNLMTSGGTDSHQATDIKSYNGLFAGQNAFDATGNSLIGKLIVAKERFYEALK